MEIVTAEEKKAIEGEIADLTAQSSSLARQKAELNSQAKALKALRDQAPSPQLKFEKTEEIVALNSQMMRLGVQQKRLEQSIRLRSRALDHFASGKASPEDLQVVRRAMSKLTAVDNRAERRADLREYKAEERAVAKSIRTLKSAED